MMISDDYASIKRRVADGKYHWMVTANKAFFGPTLQATRLPGKESVYQICMEARVAEGPSSACFGLILSTPLLAIEWA